MLRPGGAKVRLPTTMIPYCKIKPRMSIVQAACIISWLAWSLSLPFRHFHQIPHQHTRVLRAGSQQIAVRRESEEGHRAGVADERVQRLAPRQIVDAHAIGRE